MSRAEGSGSLPAPVQEGRARKVFTRRGIYQESSLAPGAPDSPAALVTPWYSGPAGGKREGAVSHVPVGTVWGLFLSQHKLLSLSPLRAGREETCLDRAGE